MYFQPTVGPLPLTPPLSGAATDADRARKHGMDEFISADPCKFDHAALFQFLQALTLDHRLSEPIASLVSSSTTGSASSSMVSAAGKRTSVTWVGMSVTREQRVTRAGLPGPFNWEAVQAPAVSGRVSSGRGCLKPSPSAANTTSVSRAVGVAAY